ncbi:ATP-DEPENDENT RNA HELICASE (PRE-mRNA SPLICING) [Encephalitozoon cuniculi GB-M1]|uniref:ATP-dependent RNA helicase n=1 Tax=Encephalitozoon cuniculi (strain GB-M1) TaxID=284813 RepID=Q8SRV1_ENCCU|nr:uncharacterized protein ECU05_1270 [Encephalitozoon cuniculi GB-M1]CAD26647.2 ATP-DEPENDENT RNA HELICASE (PRE-mRNA SPLICING) [Encephalitozoon cuniculi GB-M1]
MRNPLVLRSLKNKILEKTKSRKQMACTVDTPRPWRSPRIVSNGSKEPLTEWPSSFNKGLLPPHPTDVQRFVIPYILAGEGVDVISETGSGKTLSYVLPHIHLLESGDKRLLVIVPTRELVSQVGQVFRKFSEGLLRIVEITGEVSIESQRLQVSRPFDVAISTPGRLRELLELKSIGGFEYVVVDEADRLMQHDIRSDVTFILERMKPEVASFFSATPFEWSGGTRILVGNVSVGRDVEEFFMYVEKKEKMQVLGEILVSCEGWLAKNMGVDRNGLEVKKIIVFCNSIRTCENLHKRFRQLLVLHSRRTMQERKAVIEALEGERAVLIATDLGGRGIDIKDVDLVVNYDLPRAVDGYVHRCGRTGRQRKGMALSMICREDREILPKLKRLVEKRGGTVPGFMNVKEDVILD